MTDEPLTRWEIRTMIADHITAYDVKQDQRHRENSTKLDRLVWMILGTLITAVGSLTMNILAHLWK